MREQLRKIPETEEKPRTGQPRRAVASPSGLRVSLRPTSEAAIARREPASANSEQRAPDNGALEGAAGLATVDATRDSGSSERDLGTGSARAESAPNAVAEAAPTDLRSELRSRFLTRQNPNGAQAQPQLGLPRDERGGVATEVQRGETLHVTQPKNSLAAPRAKAEAPARQLAAQPLRAQKLARRAPEPLAALQPKAALLDSKAPAMNVTSEKPSLRAKPPTLKVNGDAAQVQLKRPNLNGANATQRAEIERELKQSQTHAAQFMHGMRARRSRLERLGSTLPTGIKNATRSAVTNTQAAGRRQRAAVTARIAQLVAQASATAASTERQISSTAAAAKASVPRITQTLSQQMKSAHDDALAQAEAKREPQRAIISGAYEGKRGAFQAAGEAIGAKAPPQAALKAQAYLARPTPADQDGLLFMGVREADQNKARADAAHQVGASYSTGLPEEAAKQLDRLKSGSEEGFGVEHDFGQLEELIFKPFRLSADDLQKNGLDALKTSEAQALEGIEQAKAQFSQSLQARLQSTLAQLNSERGSLTQIIDHLTARNVAQINTQGDASTQRIGMTLRTLAEGVDRAMSGVQGKLNTQGAPKPKELQRVLRAIEKQVEAALGTQVKGAQQSSAQTQKQLETTSAQGAARLSQTASSGLASARSSEAQLIQAAAGLIAAATQSFQALEQSHQTGAQKHLESSQANFKQMLGGVDQILNATPTELDKKLNAALESMKAGLEQSLQSMSGVIEKNAEDAASKVPPRWKGLLKILLVIAVLIVVALVLGPAVIAAAATLLGSGLLGAIVGGAILGAVSGAVIQMGNNAIDEKPIMEGVGKAALTGAVAGAVGGFLGAGVGALTSGITSTGARIAVGGTLDVGVGLVSGGVGQLAGGDSIGQVLAGFQPDRLLETLSSPDQLIGMAMSIASHKSLPAGSRVHVDGVEAPRLNLMERTQAKFAGMGENFGFKVADVTGLKTANVRTNTAPRLEAGESKISGFNERKTSTDFGEGVPINDRRIHLEEAKIARADNSDFVKIKEKLFGSDREFTPGTKGYELNAEAGKHQRMADWRFEEAQRQKTNGNIAEHDRLIQQAHDLQAASHDYQERARDPQYRNEVGDGEIAGGKRTYDNHDEIKELTGKPFDKTKLPDGYATFELEGGRKVAARLTPEGTIDLKLGVLLVNEKGNVSVSPQNRVSYDYIKVYENNPNARAGIGFGRDGYTVHHMIADKVASGHPLTVKAMELYGFNIDQFGNYAAMPMKEQFFKLDGTEVGHWSSHPDFDAGVVERLGGIQEKMQADYGDISGWSTHPERSKIAAELKQEITNLQINTFERIKNGQVPMTDEGTSNGFGRIN